MTNIYPDKLANRNFILLCCCNFFFTSSMLMSLPVMPLYLKYELNMSTGTTGVIVALYSIAALFIRPFSGYIVDYFQRRPVYLLVMSGFVLAGTGYIFITNLLLLAAVRTLHGVCFGMTGTSINTMAVDFIPKHKIGTGIGIFGMLGSVALAAGPMFGMFFSEFVSYRGVFVINSIIALVSLICGAMVKTTPREIVTRGKKPTLDNFFLKKGTAAAISFILAGFSYGLIGNYISLLAVSRNLTINTGVFFMLMAIGMVFSRLFAGKLVDKGHLLQAICASKIIIIASLTFFLLTSSQTAFFGSALFMGIGYGMFAPAYQAMFISLADRDKIGTANSTYYISWDTGISVAIFTGGYLADLTSLPVTFAFGTALVVVSLIFFLLVTARKYRVYRQADKNPG